MNGAPEQVESGSGSYDRAPGYVSGEDRLQKDDIEQDGARSGAKTQENGALSAFWIMFSTPQNAGFFLAVALTGVGKGVINTFLYVW